MRRSLYAVVLIVLLVGQVSALAAGRLYTYTVRGRVVDSTGKPIARATVMLKSPDYSYGDIVYQDHSDENGQFFIQKKSEQPIYAWRLWVSDDAGLPPDTDQLLDWDTTFCGQFYKDLCGKPVTVFPNRINSFGDVRAIAVQRPVLVHLTDSIGKPLIDKDSDDFTPWWRVRDPAGDIISEGGSASVHYRFQQSAIQLALPVGKWILDISDDNGSDLGGSFEIDVLPSELNQSVTCRLDHNGPDTAVFEGFRKYAATSRKGARQEIIRRGFEPTQREFEKRVRLGNHALVELFLRAGMDPNVLTKNRELEADAISRGRVLKLLVEAGADVNRRIEGDFTPLLHAAGWNAVRASSVKLLLDAGADIAAKTKNGRDVFYLARDRDDVLAVLKNFSKKK